MPHSITDEGAVVVEGENAAIQDGAVVCAGWFNALASGAVGEVHTWSDVESVLGAERDGVFVVRVRARMNVSVSVRVGIRMKEKYEYIQVHAHVHVHLRAAAAALSLLGFPCELRQHYVIQVLCMYICIYVCMYVCLFITSESSSLKKHCIFNFELLRSDPGTANYNLSHTSHLSSLSLCLSLCFSLCFSRSPGIECAEACVLRGCEGGAPSNPRPRILCRRSRWNVRYPHSLTSHFLRFEVGKGAREWSDSSGEILGSFLYISLSSLLFLSLSLYIYIYCVSLSISLFLFFSISQTGSVLWSKIPSKAKSQLPVANSESHFLVKSGLNSTLVELCFVGTCSIGLI